MMPFDSVTPRIGFRRSAKNRKIIFFRVAVLVARVLNSSEHVFKAHDGHCLDVPRLAESGTKQRASQVLLIARSRKPYPFGVRDLNGDFGADLLKLHYDAHH